MRKILLLGFLLATCSGCSLIKVSPITDENRSVTPLTNRVKKITFHEEVEWIDDNPANRGILIPKGIFALEAKDDKYSYFRSAKGIGHRVYQNGKPVQTTFKPGGICITDSFFLTPSAGAYVSIDDKNKKMVWKLGTDFMMLSGSAWSESFNGGDVNLLDEFDISPDDQSIAFAYRDGTNYSIHVADINGANAKLLAYSDTYQYHDPCFFPDGSKIIFTSFRSGDGGITSHLHVLNLNDNAIKHLKFDMGYITDTVVSPNGESIFFVSSGVYTNYSPVASPGFHGMDIYSVHTDGSNLRKLTNLNSYGLSDLSLSSDGKIVYFLDNSSVTPKFCSFPLTDPKKTTALIGKIWTAQLSSDDQYVAFTKSVSGDGVYAYDLHLFNVQNKQVTRLTSLRKNVRHACFLKNEGKLLFTVDQNWPGRSQAHQLFQVNMDGSGLKEIDLLIPTAESGACGL